MGSAASAGVAAGVKATALGGIQAVFTSLPVEDRYKVKSALDINVSTQAKTLEKEKLPKRAEEAELSCGEVQAAAAKVNPKRVETLTVEIRVFAMAGLICAVQAERFWDLAQIMDFIEKASDVPAQEQMLLCGTESLPSQAPLSNFSHESSVDLILIRRKVPERPPSPARSLVSSRLEDDNYSCDTMFAFYNSATP